MTKPRTKQLEAKNTNRTNQWSSSEKLSCTPVSALRFDAFPTRYVVIVVAALANTLSYTIRTNMSVTIVAMINGTALRANAHNDSLISTNSCPVNENSVTNEEDVGPFVWSEAIQGHILGSFYYGYIATNINGGQLAEWLSVRLMVGFLTLISAILTFLTPVVAHWSAFALIGLRIVTGLAQGILTPAIYAMLAHWVPRNERGLVLALIQVGGNLGAVLTLPVSGFLCKHGFAGGWPSVFYVIGMSGVVCFCLWMYCIYDTPALHPRISEKERALIQQSVNVSNTAAQKGRKTTVPWIQIFMSLPMWAIAVAKFCGAWGNLMLMAKLPTYLESVLHMPIEMNGMVSAVVYVALSVSLVFFGCVSDFIGKKRYINDTLSRKIFETIALVGPAICLAVLPLIQCNIAIVISLLVLAMTVFGMNAGGDKPAVVDIAPDHSGTIYGITNAIASLPGFLAPIYVGVFLNGKYGSITQWSYVFYSSAGIYIFGAIFFILFGTARAQSWGVIESRSRQSTFIQSRKATICSIQSQSQPQSFDVVFTISDCDQFNQRLDEQNGCQLENDAKDGEEEVYFKERRFSIFPIP